MPYGGKRLTSQMHCFWKVRLWTNQGDEASAWSDPASWRMGLLQPEDWKGQWIRKAYHKGESEPRGKHGSNYYRTTFELEDEARSGFAVVNVPGYYELYVNGRKVGDDVLSPATSFYRERLLYVTYDISSFLKRGANCVGLWVGRGWHTRDMPGIRDERPEIRFQAIIHTSDKQVEVVSDENWRSTPSPYTTTGPWVWNSFGGELYDARLEIPDWASPAYDDAAWSKVELAPAPAERAVSQSCPLNRIGDVSLC